MNRKFKKFICLFLFFLFLVPIKAHAFFNSFEKYIENPLNKADILQHSIIYEDQQFKMWYAGFKNGIKILKSTSSNGYTWDEGVSIVIEENNDYHDPSIINLGDKKILYYATSNSGSNYKIKRAETSDEINFNNINEILTPQENWEYKAVSCPFIFYKNNTYYLFYCGWGNQGWNIGLAISSDGINFNRCTNNPLTDTDGNIIPGGSSFLLEKNGKYYLFFHTWYALGIDVIESEDQIGCNMAWKNRRNLITKDQSYDQNHIVSPSIVERDEQILLYYTGLGSDGVWRLNLAISEPTISPTPTLTPTPTPFEKQAIIFIPGFMASWNKDAILHNKTVKYTQWKIAPFIKEYIGVINSLKNIGFVENQDFFIFPYDWRQTIEKSVDDLKKFIEEKGINGKLNIVGHSTGGLIGRIFAQKFGTENIDKIITIASSHKGIIQVYKLLEAGELDKSNDFLWLAGKTLIALNKKNPLESDKAIITKKIPVLYDLFPVFNFLKNKSQEEIPIESLSIKNLFLTSYNNAAQEIFPKFTSIFGEKGDRTPGGFSIEERTVIDNLLGNYPDGHPVQMFFDKGDYLVLSKSADLDSDSQKIGFDHTELVTEKESIKKIFDQLNLSYQEDQIVPGEKTILSPSLIFIIKSPAEIEVEYKNTLYKEKEGIIFIPNAPLGNYVLRVKGKEAGNYSLIIGLIGEEKDTWNKIEGTIREEFPVAQQDIYTVYFDPKNPKEFPVNEDNISSLFNALITEFKLSNTTFKNKNLKIALKNLVSAKEKYSVGDFKTTKKHLWKSHWTTVKAWREIKNKQKDKVLQLIEELENLYEKSLKNLPSATTLSTLQKRINVQKNIILNAENRFLKLKKRGRDVKRKVSILLHMKNKLSKTEEALNQGNLHYVEILLQTNSYLKKELE